MVLRIFNKSGQLMLKYVTWEWGKLYRSSRIIVSVSESKFLVLLTSPIIRSLTWKSCLRLAVYDATVTGRQKNKKKLLKERIAEKDERDKQLLQQQQQSKKQVSHSYSFQIHHIHPGVVLLRCRGNCPSKPWSCPPM